MQSPLDFEGLVYNVSRGTFNSTYWEAQYFGSRKWWQVEELDSIADRCVLSRSNVTLDLTPRWLYSFLPVNRWANQVFVKLWQQLASNGEVVVDSHWPTWFAQNSHGEHENLPCVYKLADLNQELQQKIRSLAANSFFAKRFKSIAQEEDSGAVIRQQVGQVLSSLLKPQPHILKQADANFPARANVSQRPRCLGVYIPDPGYRRKSGGWIQQKYPRILYQEYITAYVEAGGTCLYLASDSYSIWEDFRAFAFNRTPSVYTQAEVVRNRNQVPAHYMEESIKRLGSETLVDVLNLKRCGILVHGYSQISEAAVFWNPALKSIMMPDRSSLETFTAVVRSMLS
jgi:hypothetical protein